jgi:N-ethylmaleimide reductase
MPFGAVNLSHRIVAAAQPLFRAGQSLEVILRHYGSAATRGGLLLAEPASVSGSAQPGIRAESEVQAWRKLVDEVQARGGRMILPIWHGALAHEERPAILDAFLQGARCAKAAGFDGVEIDVAGGWLLERCVGLLLDIAEAVYSVWGKGRVGIRLGGHDPSPLLSLASGMNRFERSFLHMVGAVAPAAELRRAFWGTIIVTADLDDSMAEALIAARQADLIRFGTALTP